MDVVAVGLDEVMVLGMLMVVDVVIWGTELPTHPGRGGVPLEFWVGSSPAPASPGPLLGAMVSLGGRIPVSRVAPSPCSGVVLLLLVVIGVVVVLVVPRFALVGVAAVPGLGVPISLLPWVGGLPAVTGPPLVAGVVRGAVGTTARWGLGVRMRGLPPPGPMITGMCMGSGKGRGSRGIAGPALGTEGGSGGGGEGVSSPSCSLFLALLACSQPQHECGGGPPGVAVLGVALEGELELALLGWDEAAGPGQMGSTLGPAATAAATQALGDLLLLQVLQTRLLLPQPAQTAPA
ncbi:hypothetical protein JZ751_006730, partial [Albula glossodonta]